MGFFEGTIAVLVIALILYPWSRIFRKAGYTPWLCLLILVPLVNIALLWWFALAKWPIQGDTPAAPAYH
jgi:ATP/ADP translocase